MSSQTLAQSALHPRRYDLDWLRAIAFLLLIFYHIGMFYVPWGWHVKSAYVTSAPETVMLLMNPWRLALLWLISGVAVRFMADRMGTGRFVGNRIGRLLPPLLMGIYLVVPPQSWFELQAQSLAPNRVAEFYRNYVQIAPQTYPMVTPTWNHLWYVVYLLAYCLVMGLLIPLLKPFRQGIEKAISFLAQLRSSLGLLLFFPIPFLIMQILLGDRFPVTHALVDDWSNHAQAFTMFLLGYFVAKNAGFWQTVAKNLTRLVWLVPLGGLGLISLWSIPDLANNHPMLDNGLGTLKIFYAWWMICFLAGLAQKYLNQPSALLRYLTQNVFCWYILHQTIIIIAGVYLTRQALGGAREFFYLIVITIVGVLLGAEIVRRIPLLRIFFGYPAALKPISLEGSEGIAMNR